MRTETRTYEVYNLHELTRDAQAKAHSRWMEDFDYAWANETERPCKPLNGYSISRRKDGHTMATSISIASLLITAKRKII